MNIELQKLDPENENTYYAHQLIEQTDHSVFLTGKAGTGKSTFLHFIARNTRKKHIVVAPTGIAAINARGVTIHSFFQLPFGPIDIDDNRINLFKFQKEKRKIMHNLELLIIDEISMVRADLMDGIDFVLRSIRRIDEPFGGVQLLLVGDLFQLEPVVTIDEKDILEMRYESPFFFHANVFEEIQNKLVNIELHKIYRQKNDQNFVKILNKIRINKAGKHEVDQLNERMQFSPGNDIDEFVITLASRKFITDRLNKKMLAQLPGLIQTYPGQVNDLFPLSTLPTDLELKLKEGAQVIFIRNDVGEDKKWVNGTIAKIAKLEEKEITVRFEDGSTSKVKPIVWENIRYEYDEKKKQINEKVVGTFCQFPIKLAWAITIHKSQGLTFDRVQIDMGTGAFAAGQTYVALSRCRSMDGIFLNSPIRETDFIVRKEVLDFCENNNDMNQIKKALKIT